jgi:hypothetical protein
MINEQTRICKEYLEIRLGQPLDYEQLGFKDLNLKNRLNIKDADLYNNIAKSLGVHELKQVRNNLLYTLKIPDEENIQWTVALAQDNLVQFKQKYGKDYKIR